MYRKGPIKPAKARKRWNTAKIRQIVLYGSSDLFNDDLNYNKSDVWNAEIPSAAI